MADPQGLDRQGLDAALTLERGGQRLVFEASLPPRGVTALFGASGVGKTSCLRMIAGLDPLARGVLSFNGQIWQDSRQRIFLPPHRRRIGYVTQEPGLFDHLDVRGNLDFAARRAGRKADGARDDLIERFGLEALLTRRVGSLSGGERQRVAIVRALLSDPALLLFDEPLTGLDDGARQGLLELLERVIAHLSAPVLYVTHAIDEVARLADHIVVLDQGKVSAQGPLSTTVTRLDLPPALIEAAGAVVDGVVVGHDADDQLTELAFAGGRLLLPRRHARVGARVRCRIAARDVALSEERQSGTSALNQLECRIIAAGDADHPSQRLVQLDAGGVVLLARVTLRSWRALDLSPGKTVWAQVKAVALGSSLSREG
jgi:molybdate transport system ATP-binding protein